MKLEHFIKALKHNNILFTETVENESSSGVLKFNDYISLTYYQNDEVIQSAQLMYAAIASYKPEEQLGHINDVLNLSKLITDLICNVDGIEVLRLLGMFSNEGFKPKEIIYLDNMFKVDCINGIMMFTMSNEVNTGL